MNEDLIFELLFDAIPEMTNLHNPRCAPYALLRRVARRKVEESFAAASAKSQPFGPFGELLFPYQKMGAIDTLDLFGIDELVIFAFYWANRKRYSRTLDLGANLGLHSLIMSRCGFDVTCYEPDPEHFAVLNNNMKNNDIKTVTPVNAAVSAEEGSLEFIRVLGNTTGSHLAGSKSNVYGDTDRFPVEVHAFNKITSGVDLIKLDIEGHERVVLEATTIEQWRSFDMIAEIGSEENAGGVFKHLDSLKINMFAQKLNWGRVEKLSDMPTSYKDGSLFISTKASMPWA